MYIFIAALLLNSVLYSTTIYPKLLIDFLSEKQVTTYSACLFQFFMFYTLGGSEFFLLAAMAYDRYVAICKPLQYHIIMRKTTVSIFLIIAWLVPACHIAVQAIGSANIKLCDFNIKGIFCNNAVYTLLCERSRLITIFGVVALLDLAVLPMLFIVFTYTKIFIVSYQRCKEIQKKAAETCLPHLLVLISASVFFVYDRVPVMWKTSCFVPVPKTPCPSGPQDYRPVALTSHIMKTLERLILDQLRPIVRPHLDPLQFTYQPRLGTEDAIIYLLNHVYTHLDQPASTADPPG
ncbi:olfactory receptor 4P4-like [Pundamilia nyererei]|uniref:Olfactory receptor 4P4-like n=1 Tax=Pundamilia nyererei TaxID=303518 RepID=A0A9Y6JGV1_9CICH|nr:PREDICTED: olfactory receptor 4P4-like [Pundamilia nyererei]